MIWGFLIPGWVRRGLAYAGIALVALGAAFLWGMRVMAGMAKTRALKKKVKTLEDVMERKDDARKTSDADLADRLSRK